ncbi:DUF1146 family protein [Streptococcus sp. DD13]|uniref:DUF1146 family protein n=1 Tax=Streptococcus sp. DD13 TaxID=1777881 RepID=UPI00079AB0CE|nr:DUF1146 family protein [Streptococcus sp. DD13]KXT79200.1 hypothetical protein STRDD13_00131 [Streptococcus sp. DD13]
MFYQIVSFVSHLFFIYMTYSVMVAVVDWSKVLKGNAENSVRIQIFVLFLAIAIGYMVSNFFLEMMTITQNISESIRNR